MTNDPVSLFEGKLDDPVVLDAALGALLCRAVR